jgi:hypothetical protein
MRKKHKKQAFECVMVLHTYTYLTVDSTYQSNQNPNNLKNVAEKCNKMGVIFTFVKRPNRVNRRRIFHIFITKRAFDLLSRNVSAVVYMIVTFEGVGGGG